jgi:hypothetical protein
MKKALKSIPGLVPVLILIISISCTKTPVPGFTYDPEVNPEAGDTIRFMNSSDHADSYEWDFGDGGTSTDHEPFHIYSESGSFQVSLTASNDKKSEEIAKTLQINDPTVMDILVIGIDEDTIVLTDADVWVYDNDDDANGWPEVEPRYQDITDEEGIVIFSNLESVKYIIIAFRVEESGIWYGGGKLIYPLEQNKYTLLLMETKWFLWEEDTTSTKSAVLKGIPDLPKEFTRLSENMAGRSK